jgi:hypothetical protein
MFSAWVMIWIAETLSLKMCSFEEHAVDSEAEAGLFSASGRRIHQCRCAPNHLLASNFFSAWLGCDWSSLRLSPSMRNYYKLQLRMLCCTRKQMMMRFTKAQSHVCARLHTVHFCTDINDGMDNASSV